MTYINHRQAAVHDAVDRIYDFIHRGHAAQRAVDDILEEAGKREAGRQGIHPREGGGKRLPKRSARPRNEQAR